MVVQSHEIGSVDSVCADFWHGVLLGVLFIIAGHCFLCIVRCRVAVTILYNVVMMNMVTIKGM